MAIYDRAISSARHRLLTLLAAASLFAAGCGGGGGGGGDDAEAVERVVSGYLAALAAGDGARACGLLTENAQLGVFEFERVHANPDHPGEACAAVASEYDAGADRDALRSASVGEVVVDGSDAGAVVEGVPVKLRLVEGEWRIDVFGLARDVAEAQ